MARPKEFEDLTTTSLTVGREQLREAKDRGLNLSDLLRGALNSALKTPVKRAKASKTSARVKKKIRGIPKILMHMKLGMVAKNPSVADRHAVSLNARCNTSLTGQDLLTLIPRY